MIELCDCSMCKIIIVRAQKVFHFVQEKPCHNPA